MHIPEIRDYRANPADFKTFRVLNTERHINILDGLIEPLRYEGACDGEGNSHTIIIRFHAFEPGVEPTDIEIMIRWLQTPHKLFNILASQGVNVLPEHRSYFIVYLQRMWSSMIDKWQVAGIVKKPARHESS